MRIRFLTALFMLMVEIQVRGQVGQDIDAVGADVPTSATETTLKVSEYANLRLTNHPSESANPRAVVDAEFLYIVWEDTRDGNREVFWQRFSRTGSELTSPINLSNTSDSSVKPAIGVDSAENSYVVWQEGTPWGTVYGVVIDSDGAVIEGPSALSANLCLDPDISVRADGLNWVVYHRRSASDQNVYARISTSDFAQVCARGLNAGTLPEFDKTPAVAINTSNGEGYVAWRDMDTWWYDGVYTAGFYASNCGTKFSRRQATGEYINPDVGFSGTFAWMVAQLSSNVYNLYGTGSIYRINDVAGTAVKPRVGDDPNYGYAVWQDSRDGNSEIYVSRAYGNTAFTDERVTEDASSSANPDIATYNPVPGEWWVVWQDNRDGNWEIYMTTNVDLPPSLVLKDGSSPSQAIESLPYKIYKVHQDNSEVLLDEGTTGVDGLVGVSDGTITVGDTIRVEVLAHTLPAQKDFHGLVDNIAHQIYIDNAEIAATGPLIIDDLYQGVANQEIILDHTVVKYNLLVVVEFDATEDEMINIKTAFEWAANYLFDVTDGQATLDQVAIYDNGWHDDHAHLMSAADVKIMAANDVKGKPGEAVFGYYGYDKSKGCREGGVWLARCIYSDNKGVNAKLINEQGIDWCDDLTEWLWWNWYYPGIQGIVHELGHYLLYLGDEYTDRYPDNPAWCAGDVPNYNFGLMDEPYYNQQSDDEYGEMSCEEDYNDAGSYNTHQWCLHQSSCWTKFEDKYEKGIPVWNDESDCWAATTMPFTNIVTPQDQPDGFPLSGPNNDIENPDINCGEAANVWYWNMTGPGNDQALIHIIEFKGAVADLEVVAQVLKANTGYVMQQGIFDEDGSLTIVGVRVDDTVQVYGSGYDSAAHRQRYVYSELVLDETFADDTLTSPLSELPDSLPLATRFLATGVGSLQVISDFAVPFAAPPVIVIQGVGGHSHTEQMTLTGGSYESSAGIVSGEYGDIQLTVTADKSPSYVIPGAYLWTIPQSGHYVSTALSKDYSAGVRIDTLGNHFSAVVVGHSSYHVPPDGLPAGAVIAAQPYTVSVYPSAGAFAGDNVLWIPYSIPSTAAITADALSMYRWDSMAREWANIGGYADTVNMTLVAPIDQAGLFVVAGSPGTFTCGDVDGSGSLPVDISDLVYLIDYVFRDGPPPPVMAAADVDGSGGIIDISDLVYLIDYMFTGGPVPQCSQ